MADQLLPTTVVGSYPQPDWLVDRELLKTMVPRVRVHELWRVAEPYLAQAQDDATVLAIRDMERAGIDIITDGEMRRESYSNRFATALDGIDNDNPATITNRAGRSVSVPRVVGRIARKGPVEVEDMKFLRRHTKRKAKITLPGPFTMAQQAHNEFYKDNDEMVMDFAAAVNEEVRDLEAAGADVIQLDDPWLRNDPGRGEAHRGASAQPRAAGLEGADRRAPVLRLRRGGAGAEAVRLRLPAAARRQHGGSDFDRGGAAQARPRHAEGLSGKTIMLGVIDLGDRTVETADTVAERIRAALEHVPAERLVPAPDCGMKYLSREVAYGKLLALAAGAAIVRRELT